MVNPSDLSIQISDYNFKALKKFAKLFSKYSNISAWTAPEILGSNETKADFSYDTTVDVYSFAMILFELETGNIPFNELDIKQIKSKIL